MKKKILLTILVVLLVGILTVSALACSGGTTKPGNKKPKKGDKTQNDEPINEGEGFDWKTAIDEIGVSLDSAAAEVRDMSEGAGTVKATVFVGVDAGMEDVEPIALEIRLAASIDQKTAAKNWANIEIVANDKEVLGVAVRATQDGEYLYIAQPFVTGKYEWVKMSQFEDADLVRGIAVNAIVNTLANYKNGITKDADGNETTYADLVKDAVGDDAKKAAQEALEGQKNFAEGKFITKGKIGGMGIFGLVSSILPLVADSLFTMPEGAETPKTAEGYELNLDVSGLGALIGKIKGLISGLKLPKDYVPLINKVADILLGAEIKFADADEEGKVTIADVIVTATAENLPKIQLNIGLEEGAFTGLNIKYAKGDVKVAFGLKDIVIKAESEKAETIKADELALKLGLTLDLPAIAEKPVAIDVVVQPNVKMSFWQEDDESVKFKKEEEGKEYSRKGYVKLDFSGLYGYATLNGETIIAEYSNELKGFNLNLLAVAEALGLDAATIAKLPGTSFFIPLDAQTMFDNWIDGKVVANNTEETEAPQSASGNLVDDVASIVESFFDENGTFTFNIASIGTILDAVLDKSEDGLVGTLKTLIQSLITKGSDGDIEKITIDFEKLMGNKGIIGSLIGGSEFLAETEIAQVYEGDNKTPITLPQILAKDALLETLVGFINAGIYEANANKTVAEDGTVTFRETITEFQERIAENTIADNGYVWTTKEDVKELAMAILGIEADDVAALYADFYKGTKAELLLNDGSAELKLALGGATASLKLSVEFVENVEVADNDKHVEMGKTVINTSVDNGTALFNTLIMALNTKLPAKYQLATIPATEPVTEPEA